MMVGHFELKYVERALVQSSPVHCTVADLIQHLWLSPFFWREDADTHDAWVLLISVAH